MPSSPKPKHKQRNRYYIVGDGTAVLTIIRRDGSEHTFTLDEADVERAKLRVWRINYNVDPNTGRRWHYAAHQADGLLSRWLVPDAPADHVLTYANGDRTDNQRANLIVLTPSDAKLADSQVYRSNTGHRNVCKVSGRYRVVIKRGVKTLRRTFKTLDKAICVRDAWLSELPLA